MFLCFCRLSLHYFYPVTWSYLCKNGNIGRKFVKVNRFITQGVNIAAAYRTFVRICFSFLERRHKITSYHIRMPRPGLEPGTSASSAQRSPRLSYLGTQGANCPHRISIHRKNFSDGAVLSPRLNIINANKVVEGG